MAAEHDAVADERRGPRQLEGEHAAPGLRSRAEHGDGPQRQPTLQDQIQVVEAGADARAG